MGDRPGDHGFDGHLTKQAEVAALEKAIAQTRSEM